MRSEKMKLRGGTKKFIKAGKTGKIMAWNKGNSNFLTKKDEFELILQTHEPLALGIVEANIEPNCHKDSMKIEGYTLQLDNLEIMGHKSRTAAYINDDLKYERRRDLEPPNSPTILIEINGGSPTAWLIFFGYREWRCLWEKNKRKSELMCEQLKRLNSWGESWILANMENKPIFVIGDFNIDVSPWLMPSVPQTLYQKSKVQLLSELKSMANSCQLELLQSENTRKQGKNKASILDIILTNKPAMIAKTEHFPSSSDHHIIAFNKIMKKSPKEPLIMYKRNFKNYSKMALLNQINIPMLNSLLFCSDTELVANVFTTHITNAINVVAPLKNIQKRKSYAPHLSLNTKDKMLQRDLAKEKFNWSQSPDDHTAFKKLRNQTLKCQRADKRKWALDLMDNDIRNSKDMWATAKKIGGENKKNTIEKMSVNGIITTSPGEIAQGLNEAFSTKIQNFIKNMPPQHSDLLGELKEEKTMPINQMMLMTISEYQLNTMMKDVKMTQSAGNDAISGIILKDIYDSVKRVLLHLINLSLCSGVYPTLYKTTKIIPVLKQGKSPLQCQ